MPQPAQSNITPSIGATPQPRPIPTKALANDNTPPQTGATSQSNTSVKDGGSSKKGAAREPRIDQMTAVKMLATAILLDLIALIPIIGGYAAEIIGGLTFWLWFLIIGLPLVSPKTIANWGLNLLLGESVTAGAWPGFTVAIIITIIITRFEDKTGVDVIGAIKNPARLAQVPQQTMGELKKELGGVASTFQARNTDGMFIPTGATLPALNQALNENPVIASQQEHFADPSQPISKGPTPQTPSKPRFVPRGTTTNPQDEEVATGHTTREESVSYHPDTYREDPFASESFSEPPANDNQPRGPRRLPNRETAPFPGTSPQFGRSSKYEEQEVQRSASGGKVLTFDVNRKAPLQQDKADEIPKGATPVPKSVNDTVSSEE